MGIRMGGSCSLQGNGDVVRRDPEDHKTSFYSSANLKPHTGKKMVYFETRIYRHLQIMELSSRDRDDVIFIACIIGSGIGTLHLGLLGL
jgi:hypothetical protein